MDDDDDDEDDDENEEEEEKQNSWGKLRKYWNYTHKIKPKLTI